MHVEEISEQSKENVDNKKNVESQGVVNIINPANVAIGSIGGNNSGNVGVNDNTSKHIKRNWKKIIGCSIAVLLLGLFAFLFYKEYQMRHDIVAVLTSESWLKWLSFASAILLAIVSPLLKNN